MAAPKFPGADQVLLSGEGQRRRFDRLPFTSGLPLETDIVRGGRYFANVPNGGHRLLFNHFVRAGKQRRRHLKSERLGGLQVDYQFDPRRLLDGELAGFGPI